MNVHNLQSTSREKFVYSESDGHLQIPETGRVVFGATIDLYDITNEKPITYKIVGNLESDPEAGLISIQTPIAQGLMGKNVGEEVTISTPSGSIDLEIEKVQHL